MIAIFISAHKNLNQVRRLINSLKHDEIDIYMHVDSKCELNSEDFKDIYLLSQRFDIKWGDLSQLNSFIMGLKKISDTKKYEHIFVISGQDYLLKPVKELVSFLHQNRNKIFLKYDEITSKDIAGRYLEYHTNNRYIDAILRRIMPKRKIFDVKTYFGSCWFAITDDAVKYIIFQYDKYVKKLKYTICMDEVFVHTVLLNSKFKNDIVNDNLFYIDWSDHIKGLNNGNPNILKTENFDKIIKSGKYFARKFDSEVDSEILDKLDKYRGDL
ncbi:MAG: hypothetical protein IJ093_00980 [Bacilli bacterium]|nr:hypothetical protein [Bacilli bacterium]